MVLTELRTRKKSKKQNEAVTKKLCICTIISGQKPDMNQTITTFGFSRNKNLDRVFKKVSVSQCCKLVKLSCY